MANNFYCRTSLIGGLSGALDEIDGAGLNDLDFAIVSILSKVYMYTLDDDSGAAESSPQTIKPDANAGTKRWVLQGVGLPLSNTPATPALAFGDGNSGLDEESDNVVIMSILGNAMAKFQNGWTILGVVGGGILNETATATNPTYVLNSVDIDTGLGWGGADELSLIAGGVQVANFKEAAGVIQVILPLQDNATFPSLAFGDGNSGFYESLDDKIAVAINGSKICNFQATSIHAGADKGGNLNFAASTSTSPAHTFRGDLDTGVGWTADDQLSLIAGGVQVANLIEDAGKVQLIVPLQNDAAKPSIAFGTGVSGFYQAGGTDIQVSINGNLQWYWTGGQFKGVNSSTVLNDVTVSATAPSHVVNGDLDTGLGWSGTDQLSLIAGGVQGANIKEDAGVVQVIVPLQDDATKPSIAFGDGDSGFYESADDTIQIAVGGAARFKIALAIMGGASSNAMSLINEVPTATNPSLAPSGDVDTGLGTGGADELSLIAGGVQGANVKENAGVVQVILPLQDNATFPSLAFGDGDSGFYESSDDVIKVTLAGTVYSAWTTSGFSAGTLAASNPYMVAEVASDTNPVFTFNNDFDTGIGRAGTDQLSLIAGGIEGHRIAEATTITHTLVGAMTYTPDEITATSEGVAASIATKNTEITTNGDSDLDNVTLANGVSGQIKHFAVVAVGNAADSVKITPATMVGGTQITFAADPTGLGCIMQYADSEGWIVIGNNGGTIS